LMPALRTVGGEQQNLSIVLPRPWISVKEA
jgi:hypothetical protein